MVDDPTFPYRVAFGLTVFGVLGAIDVVRHPRNPKRLKEYAFLFAVTGAAMLHALLHDAVTYALSPDYFRVVKGLPARSFFPEVAKLAAMAGWTAGLAVGLTLLVANNPLPRLAQLPYSSLAHELRWPLGGSVLLAATLGSAAELWPRPWVRLLALGGLPIEAPHHVAMVWAVHIGTYTGALAGLARAFLRVRRRRAG